MEHTKEPSSTPLVDAFLEIYRTSTTSSADRALAILIDKHKTDVEPLFESRDPTWLHKAFRQTDVTGDSRDDMMIWHLIHASSDFFDTLEFFWNKQLDRRNERRMGVRLLEVEAQRDELLAALKLILENDGGSGSKCFDAFKLYDARLSGFNAIAKVSGETK